LRSADERRGRGVTRTGQPGPPVPHRRLPAIV